MIGTDRPGLQLQWLLTTLRWLFLVGVIVAVAVDPAREVHSRFDLFSLTVLIVAAVLANLLLLVLQGLNLWPRVLPGVAVLVDCLIAVTLYFFYGGAATPLLFAGVLPAAVAALCYDWTVSLLVALAMAAGFTAVGGLTSEGDLHILLVLVVNASLLFGTSLLVTVVAARTRRQALRERTLGAQEERLRLRRAHERARAVYDMASTLSATLNYERVLQTALDVCELGVSELTPRAAHIVGMVLLYHEDELQIVASRHLTRSDSRVTVAGQTGLIGMALKSAEPVVTDDVTQDEDLNQVVALQECHSIVALPLRAGFENYGVMVFGSQVPNAFGDEQLELFTAVANQATISLQNARLYQSLLEEKERIIAVDEAARTKLARDLHDGPTQEVAAIAMRTNFTLRLIEREPQKAAEELRKIEELARQATREMRHMLFTLRPLVLESRGLIAALQQLCDKQRDTYGLNVILESTPFEAQVDATKQGVAFYIIEDAVGNARKHARAQHVWVRVGLKGDLFILQVEDDGVGFDVAKVEASYDKRGSLGMVNMRERVRLVNGQLHIESAPGKGARITVAVPLTEEAKQRLEGGEPAPSAPPAPPPAAPAPPAAAAPAAPSAPGAGPRDQGHAPPQR